MIEYKCVNGHDRCNQMYSGPDCPYCEKSYKAPKKSKKGSACWFQTLEEGDVVSDLPDLEMAYNLWHWPWLPITK